MIVRTSFVKRSVTIVFPPALNVPIPGRQLTTGHVASISLETARALHQARWSSSLEIFRHVVFSSVYRGVYFIVRLELLRRETFLPAMIASFGGQLRPLIAEL